MQAPGPITNRHVAKGVGTTMLARLGAVIDVVAQPLYVWMYGLASFGFYTALWAAVNLIENIADLGMTSALQRTVPQARDEVAEVTALSAAMLLGVLPCLVIAILLSATAPLTAPLLNVSPHDQANVIPGIRLFAWALPLWAFVEIATSALRAKRLFGPEIRLRLMWEQLLRMALALAFWAAGFGIMGLLMAHLCSLAITAALATRLLIKHYALGRLRAVQLATAGHTLKAGLSILPTNIVAQIFTDGPPLLLSIIIPGAGGATASGLFGITRKIASIIQLFRTAFAYVLAPLASAATRASHAEVQSLYAYTTRLTSALVLPLACVMAVSAPAILRVFGHGASIAIVPLVILIFARMVEAMSGAAKPVQQVVSEYRQQLTASIVGLALTLLILPLAIPVDPFAGTAFAVALGLMAAALIPIWQLHRHDALYPFTAPFGRLLSRAGSISVAGVAVALVVNRLALPVLQLPLLVLILLATTWAACRFALPYADRLTLGRLGRQLKLV